LTLLNNSVAAVDNTATPAYAVAQTVQIEMSFFPTSPTVSLSVPSTSSTCDDLILDFSLTSGLCGRKWRSVSFTVLASRASVSEWTDVTYLFTPQSDFITDDAIVIRSSSNKLFNVSDERIPLLISSPFNPFYSPFFITGDF
jgi:hypothetical protein